MSTKPELKKTAPPTKAAETEAQPTTDLIQTPQPSFASILQELRRNVDPKLIKEREGWRDRNGNVQTVDYVEWHTVADILDNVAPNWSHRIVEYKEIGDVMTCIVEIEIEGVKRQGIGTGNAMNEMGIKKAEHDALKRAAVKFGVARDLYRKESDIVERHGSTNYDQRDGGFPEQPVAKSLGELATAKQLGMIRAICREMRIDPDEECHSQMHCRSDELSKKAASAFIKYLQGLQRGGPAMPLDRPPLRQAQDAPAPPPPTERRVPGSLPQKTVNVLRMTLHQISADEGEWCESYSNGRTKKLEGLTQDEADTLLQEAESMRDQSSQ